MDFFEEDKLASIGDEDSGLGNSSDSGKSGDSDAASSSSDGDDFSQRDNRRTSVHEEGEEEAEQVKTINSNAFLSGNFEWETNLSDETYSKGSVLRDTENYISNCSNGNAKDVLRFYTTLRNGQQEPVDFSINSKSPKPKWLNEEKFKRGQKFARDHLFCINFAEMVSLYILFAQKSSLGPLIFTGMSDTPFTAFKRYLSTVCKLISWYTDDIWSENESLGKNNLILVRGMHKTVYNALTNSSKEVVEQKTTLGDPERTALWCPTRNLLVKDFQESIPARPWCPVVDAEVQRSVWVSQTDMSITQFGFVGLAVTYPKSFGIHLASDDDLEAFLHMWRGLGYMLGIKDEYNFCNGDLQAVRDRTLFFLQVFAKPAFRTVTCDWEHMCRCMTAGISFYLPRVRFESSLLYLCHIIGVKMPRLRKEMPFAHYFYFQLMRFVFYLMKFQSVLSWLNSALYRVIRRVQAVPPEILSDWQNRRFSYMDQPGKCPARSQT
ncbi:hypothetical protein RUM43_006085 [Polyplax serrata]|uniref:ER-bound oxygenase mpaB/mpaB'/Rubber oxygenase catalytic domain-containing protein n=1 Tax=Polyplax serrata TaxID=468196 RepID=A0AAN8PAM4_POLSC